MTFNIYNRKIQLKISAN